MSWKKHYGIHGLGINKQKTMKPRLGENNTSKRDSRMPRKKGGNLEQQWKGSKDSNACYSGRRRVDDDKPEGKAIQAAYAPYKFPRKAHRA